MLLLLLLLLLLGDIFNEEEDPQEEGNVKPCTVVVADNNADVMKMEEAVRETFMVN